jgi:DNA-binding beta-propeller fold protein YncE
MTSGPRPPADHRPAARRRTLVLSALGVATVASLLLAAPVAAQPATQYSDGSSWGRLPAGRSWGAVTGVHMDPDGRHVWVLDRCGANNCLGSDLHPVFKFDLEGNLVANFGAGVVAWPHGFFVDHEGNVWLTDGGTGARGEAAAREGKGHQVVKLSPRGEVLLTLGRPGTPGSGLDTFNGPSDVLVARDGSIFVVDGHDAGGNNRVMKFAPDGTYLTSWGYSGTGTAAGELSDPHALAMDSRGRIYVADRRNSRIQIFDQDGTFLDVWSQFGPPSDIYIDEEDVIYVTDTQTIALPPWFAERRDESWVRGIRVGDARTGRVTAFIQSDAEFVTADRTGNVYGAEVPGQALSRYRRTTGSPTPR